MPGDGVGRPKQLLVYEQRIWTPYAQEDCVDGCTFYGDVSYRTIDMKKGWKLYGRKNVLRKEAQGKYNVRDHTADFLDAIRTGRRELVFDPKREQFVDNAEANSLVKRTYREGHWAVPKGV